jgi:2-methylcitrate dehydratase
MKYCVARALLDGMLTMAQFAEDKLSDPTAIDLAGRVSFVLDDEINEIYPRAFPSIVEIVMQNGKRHKVRIDVLKGSVENPMSWQEIQEKFKAPASSVVGEKKAGAIIELVEDLENIKDVTEIASLLKHDVGS